MEALALHKLVVMSVNERRVQRVVSGAILCL